LLNLSGEQEIRLQNSRNQEIRINWLISDWLIGELVDYFEIATVAYGSFAMTEDRGPMLRQGFAGKAYRRLLNNPVINWGEGNPQ